MPRRTPRLRTVLPSPAPPCSRGAPCAAASSASPLWPLPALETPVSGHSPRRARCGSDRHPYASRADGVAAADPGGAGAARLGRRARTWTSPCRRGWSGSTRCAATRRTPRRTRSRSRLDRGRPRRLARGARAAGGGRGARGARRRATASRSIAGARRTCSSRAASASRRSCRCSGRPRGPGRRLAAAVRGPHARVDAVPGGGGEARRRTATGCASSPRTRRGCPDLAAPARGRRRRTPPVYCCGPERLMGPWPRRFPATATLHLERFAPAARRPTATGRSTVELRRIGPHRRGTGGRRRCSRRCAPRLPNIPYSCEQGFCGTCQQRVLEGEIDHRDELLTDAERDDSMLICVSRARGGPPRPGPVTGSRGRAPHEAGIAR